ncbi:hypothetical protein BJ875DRAFT_445157 [Amylocarpus encephaloides]|uniref:Uncharacterized protein n=1 Tax=Amylocarpus encephaloides TaxID=45428 RepID=A0A9P7YBM2_9HELO|nr:hypothetical protein BJ875DRAFT_445157 [Amylocarpus encephaloides]
MPPTRTMPPAKAIKTERTHEENQERAYIAASRRSDRSLEARVESARRASEIHKRRTGRSLRVTEQDVINEEMYEEEDDDLPAQYRRLTAHLQTGSADFNRRLSAYLTNHVAMRSVIEQAVNNSYAQQYGGMGQFANNTMYPSPMLAHQQQQQFQQQSRPQSPSMYRSAPYPTSRPQNNQDGKNSTAGHDRSASIATPQDLKGANRPSLTIPSNERRISMSIAPASINSPVTTQSPLSATTPKQRPFFPRGSFSQANMQAQIQFPTSYLSNSSETNDMGPFSTALPAESQMLLGSTVNPNDPLKNNLRAGSNNLTGNFYTFDSQQPNSFSMGKHQLHPFFDGLNSTLAPSALENFHPPSDDSSQNQSFFDDALKAGSTRETPAGTPGDSWANFIDYDA